MSCIPKQDLDHVLRHTAGLWQDLRGQSVFITGGTGFVGRWLLESLLCANDRNDLSVSVVVLTRDPKRLQENAPHLAAHPALELLGGDLVDFRFPEREFPFVVHAATERPFEPDADRPLGAFSADIAGTHRVLDFARMHGARRMLFTSSGAVYGKQPADLLQIPETYAGALETIAVASAYGHAKRVSEFMCTMYGRVYGFDATIARLFAFVGPLLPLTAHYAVGNFVGDVIKGGPVRIEGDGTPYRSYLYAADLAVWLWTILLRGKAAYPYNVGSRDGMSIEELARLVVDTTAPGMPIEIAQRPVAGSPALRYVPSTERAETELGLRTHITPEQGIRRTYEWYRASGPGT